MTAAGRKPSAPSVIMRTLDTAAKASRVADLLAKVRGAKSPSPSPSPSLSLSASADRLAASGRSGDRPRPGGPAPATLRLAAAAQVGMEWEHKDGVAGW